MKTYREFYLTVYGGMVEKVLTSKPLYEDEPCIRVIDYEAYLELIEHLKRLTKIEFPAFPIGGREFAQYAMETNCEYAKDVLKELGVEIEKT